jgi:hypothetical protein
MVSWVAIRERLTRKRRRSTTIYDGYLVCVLLAVIVTAVTTATFIPSLTNHRHKLRWHQPLSLPVIVEETTDNTSNQRSLIEGTHAEQRRKIATAVTKKRLLAIRVSSAISGETPDESIASIRTALFGYNGSDTDPDQGIVSVVEQYQSISHGQFILEPVENTALSIEGGVLDLTLRSNTIVFTGHSISNLTAAFIEELEQQLAIASGVQSISLLDVADYVMFCLPNGSTFRDDSNWTAYTYLNEPYSFYQQSRCTRLSVVVHEVFDTCVWWLSFLHGVSSIDSYIFFFLDQLLFQLIARS